jgi:hypothetical protein
MPPLRDIDLMRLADGEVTGEERAALEAAAAAEARAGAAVEAIGELGELVRGHLELAADEAEPRLARMWAELDKRLDLAAPAAPAPAPAAAPGVWLRFARWIDARRGHLVTGAVSAGAVAAIALALRPEPTVIRESAVPTPALATHEGPGDDPDAVPALHTPAEVESLDVASGTSTVFTIEDENGEQTTVVWVTPDDTLEGI